MRRVTEETTLREVIEAAGMESYAYLVDPNMKPDADAGEEERKLWDEVLRGRSFGELTVAETQKLFSSWNVPSMVEGFQHLLERTQQGKLVYPIWSPEEEAKMGENKPVIMAFPVEKKSPFVLVCPGGGYGNVCSIVEGFPIAKALNELGYGAFILYYRVGEEAKAPNPQDDVARAVGFLLDRAEEFRLEPEGYGILGFSAGGHLAASFGTESLGFKKYGLPKPGAMILGYPVITMKDATHGGSRQNLLGKEREDDEACRRQFSIEEQVTAEFPRTYVWQCKEDNLVPAVNSRLLTERLSAFGISYAHEVFPGEDHGWGLGTGTAAEGWVKRAVDFCFGTR